MSQENLDVVKRGWAAWIKGDLDAVFETFDPEVEWDTTHFEGWPEDDVYHGHDGVRRFFEEWLGSWERYEAGADEFVDAGDGVVLVLCWQRGFGPGSHVPVEMEFAQVTTVRNGLVLRMEAWSDREAARATVGLGV